KMLAAQGKVEVQAQSDGLDLLAQKELTVASQDDRVVVTAKTELLLNCGGAFIRIKDGQIELGAPNNVLLKTAVVQRMSAASLNVPLPNMPLVDGCSEHFIITDQATGEPLAGVPYSIAYQQQQITGISDKQGKTIAVYSRQPEPLTLRPHIEQFNRECLNASYWDDATPLKIDFSRTDKKDEAK
ncbi:DUF2345 domain-containing protein, partial [Brenneria sp. g21c3]|uniref:DUF2345 domain-containing protein n=1 Tax=Brenneria sp. g21c3 TaxID=3093893 RepID=UPI002E9F9474|nr:DUF2345 domain-containing protein [Brenneria sp. g21c3]